MEESNDVTRRGNSIMDRGNVVMSRALNSLKSSRVTIASWVDRTQRRYPRLFNFFFMLVLPLVVLLCWSLFCGHFLAIMESEGELEANNRAIEGVVLYNHHLFNDRRNQRATGKERSMECLSQFIDLNPTPETINGTELKIFVKNCTASDEEESLYLMQNETLIEPHLAYDYSYMDAIQLHWNICPKDGPRPKLHEGMLAFQNQWNASFAALYEAYTMEGKDYDSAFKAAAAEAKGNDICRVNSAGGGLFWFTIMTTIGYGNTAPVTSTGRWFVMTFGFISILMFTAALGSIGYVSLTIADDTFHRLNMTRLTKGWTSTVFWFIMLVFSMVLLSGFWFLYFYSNGYHEVAPNEMNPYYKPYIDVFWFSFMTMTTVGLGDLYIPHDTFHVYQMFTVPLAILMGFVSLANFLMKLSDQITDIAIQKNVLPESAVSLRYLLNTSRDDEENSATLRKKGDKKDSCDQNENLQYEFLSLRKKKVTFGDGKEEEDIQVDS